MQKQFIERRKHRQSAPLSFAQQRLWFLDQLKPNSPRYNVSRALRIRGDLNLTALQDSLDEVVRRHETLRSHFRATDGVPEQVIGPVETCQLDYLDISEQPAGDRDSSLNAYLSEQVRRPYDLSSDLMLRAGLVRLGAREHVLLLILPHITTDGWSMILLCRELMTVYDALNHNQPCPLPDLPVQYADFAVWQRQWLQGEVLDRHIKYWCQSLSGVPPLELPTDHRRPDLPSSRNGALSEKYPRALTDQLIGLARTERMTLFMVLLAAFKVLLYRYTGQDDIAVGGPIANRRWVELEGLIGFFANTLVFRTSLSGKPSFRQLMTRVRATALGAYEHQDLPFEKLVEILQPERDQSRNPLVQVTFQLRNYPNELVQLSGLEFEPFELLTGIAKFDLSLAMTDEVDGLKAEIEYNTDLFQPVTIERMFGHLQVLLESIVTDPDGCIADLPIITESERHQLLVDWNNTKTAYPNDKCIHQLLEAQVEKTPDAIAVVCEDQQITYRELNSRANQLAHYLQQLGVGPDVPVGICLDRSIEMIVGLLAILKAGDAYLPLDPDYPKERLGFMLEDAQVRVLLTQQRLFSSLTDYSVICLDSDWDKIATQSPKNPQPSVTADDLAYVIFTSGSTGRPKGVEVRHRGVLRLLFGVDYARLDGSNTILQLAPISFDAATFEIWGALLHGGKCILFPSKLSHPRELGWVMKKHQVNTLWLTAGLFNSVIDEEPNALYQVAQLLIGGEALSVPHVKKALALLPNTQIVNGYGPTESTTFTCCYPIPRKLDDRLTSVPIGRPIGNTQIYLLDSSLNVVPIGVPGELHIGGAGLARGYHNRPELTAEKFIANPFSSDPTSRLYKTGDLARYLPDGNIEFLGRIDNQVKIRGFRIELGEIESVLGQHPSIQQAVILAREDTPGDRRLVAYLVASLGFTATASELRSYLQQKLPEYMVPSAFMFLDSLPLTPNGKLDRKALPAPDHLRPELEDTFTAPRTPAEEILANIWSEVLKLDKVGIHDNFFHLGGHSLLATQVASRIRDAFKLDLPLRIIFEAPTIHGLAQRLQNLADRPKVAQAAQIVPVGREQYRVEK